MQVQVVSEYEPHEIRWFASACEKLQVLTRCSLQQSSLMLQLVEMLDGDMTIDASRYGNGIIRIHRVAIDQFVISEDEF